tara:strand:+ start:1256 stop:1741 length:486 start_codon:yes stop_codon:yes gene_type:complete
MILVFLLFLIPSKTRVTALVLLLFLIPYYVIIITTNSIFTYALIATSDVIAGVFLNSYSKNSIFNIQDTSIAETYFIAVIVTIFGGILYESYQPKVYYDNMCLTIIIIQIIILTWRVFKDGKLVGRCSLLFPILGSAIANIDKRHSFLQAKKIKIKEAKEN